MTRGAIGVQFLFCCHRGRGQVIDLPRRRRGREAEGGGLLNRYTVKSRIEGSNPSVSAIIALYINWVYGFLEIVLQMDQQHSRRSRRFINSPISAPGGGPEGPLHPIWCPVSGLFILGTGGWSRRFLAPSVTDTLSSVFI